MLVLASFAVPFFLAISFYLPIGKAYSEQKFTSLKTRAFRLLIPYLFWSCVYLIVRSVKNVISGDSEKLGELLNDPVSLIFFGGAAVQLYFLPLLFTGTAAMKLTESLIKRRVNLRYIAVMFLVSLLMYELLLSTNNSFQIGNNIAFQSLLSGLWTAEIFNPLLRIIAVIVAWMIRCLPYILLAMILHHPSSQSFLSKLNIVPLAMASSFLLVFTLFESQLMPGLPSAFKEIGLAYTSLLLAIYLSKNIQQNSIITELGLCSFGIYLLHHLILEALFMCAGRFSPTLVSKISAVTLLFFSITGFLISWMAILKLRRSKYLASLM